MSNIEEFVEKLYRKYLEVTKKEEQRKKIERVIREININAEINSIWDSRKACWEYISMLPSELEEKIKEIWRYMFPRFRFISAGVHITTCNIENRENVRKDENEIIGKYIYIESDDTYLNYIKIAEIDGVDVYLVISDEEIKGDC